MAASFKLCNLCDARNSPRRRRCTSCREWPVFRQPTAADIAAYEAHRDSLSRTAAWLALQEL